MLRSPLVNYKNNLSLPFGKEYSLHDLDPRPRSVDDKRDIYVIDKTKTFVSKQKSGLEGKDFGV